jgi:hypothetical protein
MLKLWKFIANVFSFNIFFFFVNTNFFLKTVTAYNFTFNQSFFLLNNEQSVHNFNTLFVNKTKLSNFLNVFKKNIFFVFDSYRNIKILFLFKRIKKKTISIPFSPLIARIIYWPISSQFNKFEFYLSPIKDFFVFKLIVLIKKKLLAQ